MDAVAAASRNAEKHAAENEELRQRVQALESEVRAGGGGGGATVPVCRGFCVGLPAGMLSRRAPCCVDPEMVAPVPHRPLSMVWWPCHACVSCMCAVHGCRAWVSCMGVVHACGACVLCMCVMHVCGAGWWGGHTGGSLA